MKDLKELYVACGGEEAGEFVKINQAPEPFDIVLTVYPTGIDLEHDGPLVDLQVLLYDKLTANEDGAVYHREYDVSFKLPIEAIKLAE